MPVNREVGVVVRTLCWSYNNINDTTTEFFIVVARGGMKSKSMIVYPPLEHALVVLVVTPARARLHKLVAANNIACLPSLILRTGATNLSSTVCCHLRATSDLKENIASSTITRSTRSHY